MLAAAGDRSDAFDLIFRCSYPNLISCPGLGSVRSQASCAFVAAAGSVFAARLAVSPAAAATEVRCTECSKLFLRYLLRCLELQIQGCNWKSL
jgi:hypothetical protein